MFSKIPGLLIICSHSGEHMIVPNILAMTTGDFPLEDRANVIRIRIEERRGEEYLFTIVSYILSQ